MPDTYMLFRLYFYHIIVCTQALATAARTLAQPQRMPRATSQGLRPTGNPVLHTARTPTPTPLATLATKGMAAATLEATLVVEWPATFQALRPTGSLVLQVVRTSTATLGLAATRAMAATLAQVYPSVAALFARRPLCMQLRSFRSYGVVLSTRVFGSNAVA